MLTWEIKSELRRTCDLEQHAGPHLYRHDKRPSSRFWSIFTPRALFIQNGLTVFTTSLISTQFYADTPADGDQNLICYHPCGHFSENTPSSINKILRVSCCSVCFSVWNVYVTMWSRTRLLDHVIFIWGVIWKLWLISRMWNKSNSFMSCVLWWLRWIRWKRDVYAEQ